MNARFEWKDVDQVFPGLKGVWKRLRELHGIRTRAPKSFTVTDDKVQSTPWNDSYVGRLHRLDLETLDVSASSLCTTYDIAAYVSGGMVGDTCELFGNSACIKLEWNDHYRHVCMTIQVAKGRLPCAELC